MTSPDWFRWYPSKYAHGVIGLTPEQRGVYMDIINIILDRRSCPEDYRYLAKACNCRIDRLKRIVGELITAGKLSIANGEIVQERAKNERRMAEESTKIGRSLAVSRWQNQGNSSHLADAVTQMQTRSQNQKPERRDSCDSHVPPEPRTETPAGVNGRASPEDSDAYYYRKGKALLGPKSGGVLTDLRKALGLGKAIEAIDDAAHKDCPLEYVHGIIRKNRPEQRKWVGL